MKEPHRLMTNGAEHHLTRLSSFHDLELVKLLQNGCHDALTVLFERYSPLVFHIARNIVKDEWEAEETVQQVFFDMYRAIAQFNPERGAFKTWMLQFAYHRSINRREHLLSSKFYDSHELNDAIFGRALSETRSLLQLSPPEATRFIEQMLATLKPSHRRVIELTFFEGLTAEEIAGKVGQSAVVVRNYLYRGLARLRSAILERTDLERTCAARLVSAQPPTAQPAAEQKALLIPEPGLP
jgi:RNA polymerase sigma-70 factor (ECF subfamily)